jgi:hypothetical protein
MNITTLGALRTLYDPVRERSALKELPQLDTLYWPVAVCCAVQLQC